MDCLPTTLIPVLSILGVHEVLEDVEDSNISVRGVRLFSEDKDPGQGEAGLRGCVGRGENGRGIEVTASPWRQDLASLGVTNHLRSETVSGNAAVWSGTASLEASLVAEARD